MSKAALLRIYISRSACIYENLALEEWLFRHHDIEKQGEVALLWSNTPSVIIGRHQNPWLELDVEYAKAQNINLARRYSGGGTVYHDLGNINISLLTMQKRHWRPRNLANISRWLNARFDVNTEPNKRDDILLQPGDRKISGTAARISHGRAYHHLTLLVTPDLAALRRSLQSPNANTVETNATQSIRAKAVGQLVDDQPSITRKAVTDAVVEGLHETAVETRVAELDMRTYSDAQAWATIEKTADELRSSAWFYGRSPAFRITLPNSAGTQHSLSVERGRVVKSENDLYTTHSLFEEIKRPPASSQ